VEAVGISREATDIAKGNLMWEIARLS